jgi:UDP-glucuronate 4-epimerase
MRLLVTGGAGFIGSHLCESLVQGQHRTVCLDDFNDYYHPLIKRNNIRGLLQNPRFRLIEADILDEVKLDALFSEESFDTVVHLAARAGVRPSIQDPKLYQRVNIEGSLKILEACVRHRVRKIVLASSSSVYGSNAKVPFSEEDPVDHPVSPYAATKKACELIAYTYHHLHGIAATCLRFFTVYGPRQRPDMAIHRFTRNILEGRPISVFGDGSSRRDYTYIMDIIQGLLKSIEFCRDYHIYNLGESNTVTLADLIRMIEQAAGKKAVIERMADQPGDVPITYADISRARKELGYAPSVSIDKGIVEFVRWFKENRGTGS